MKNSSQRKISFLVVLFASGIFLSAGAQPAANPAGTRVFNGLYFQREMLKNKTGDFLAIPGFYPPPGKKHLFLLPDAAAKGILKQYPEQKPGLNPQQYAPYPGYYSPSTEDLVSGPVVPANIYYCQSGFFCKREWELEKTTHIAFRFRLGSLDYCNVLEGKQRPVPF
jgi:hypothetical protein